MLHVILRIPFAMTPQTTYSATSMAS